MKRILTISLFILISSKANVIEFHKEIPFDNNNNEFEFTYDKTDNFFIKITANDSCQLNLNADEDHYSIGTSGGNSGFIIHQVFSDFYKIKIESKTNVKGTFWIHPFLTEIKIDLNSTVDWNYYTHSSAENQPKLIFAIDNAEKNATFIFKYNKGIYEDNPNPFEVYHGTDYKDQVITYNFKKGESYKIYVYHYEKNKILYFPSFSIFDKTKEKKSNSFNLMLNLWNICLLLFML